MKFMIRNTIKKNSLKINIIREKDLKEFNKDIFKVSGFKAKNGQIELLDNILFVGSEGCKDSDDWRTLGFQISKKLMKLNSKFAHIYLEDGSQEFIEGLILGTNTNDSYKSIKNKSKLREITLLAKTNLTSLYEELKMASTIVASQELTQELVDKTGEDGVSGKILEKIESLFLNDKSNVKVDIYGESFLESNKMNGHLAVNRASINPALTIKLTYNPKIDGQKNLVFVGKGLTYDTGGLSIKPTNSMTTMQCDKAGAMTLIGLMDYLNEMGGQNKIVCYIALAENSIDGSAYRPGDILTMSNGKTVMINNTDAEGRIVLADNLVLAQKQNKKINAIYSIATLTGSAIMQFGLEAAGLVGFNDKMKKKIIKHGNKQGEIFLDAPFHKFMMDGVKDSIADLSNTGTSGMGCQKAGLFLTNFIEKKNINKYLHIDIAGPAWSKGGFGSYKSSATGFGVRTLIELSR